MIVPALTLSRAVVRPVVLLWAVAPLATIGSTLCYARVLHPPRGDFRRSLMLEDTILCPRCHVARLGN